MVRHCATKLSDKDKYGILLQRVAGSERLKPHLEYLERIPESHADKSYQWVSDLIDRLVAGDRRKVNVDSLTLVASGKEQRPKKVPGAPAGRQQGERDPPPPKRTPGGGGGGSGAQGSGQVPKDPKDPKGKGKGKGKDKKDRGNTGTDSEGEKTGFKPTASYPGTNVKDVPKEQQCCLLYLWVKRDRSSFCKHFNQGKECPYGRHITQCPPAMRETNLFNRLVGQHGQPNVPKAGPTAPKKEGE